MRISAITPTADRPIAFALCERWMARQTVQPDEWIVADGGALPATCTMGQIHLWHPHPETPDGPENFLHNVLNGVRTARGEIIVFIEDDDHYDATHIETLVGALASVPGTLLAGDDRLRYYNVAARKWIILANRGAALAQTAMRRDLVPLVETVVASCFEHRNYSVDGYLWRSVPSYKKRMQVRSTCVGVKGLPGRAGLGVGHRIDANWTDDPDLAKLREWVGGDVERYVLL